MTEDRGFCSCCGDDADADEEQARQQAQVDAALRDLAARQQNAPD